MKFYHGTDLAHWREIQLEGELFAPRYIVSSNDRSKIVQEVSRTTYLARDINEARCYGDIVLEVEYDPETQHDHNYWDPDCWQLRVYEPIPISKVRVVENNYPLM
jgi:hypothetical protein